MCLFLHAVQGSTKLLQGLLNVRYSDRHALQDDEGGEALVAEAGVDKSKADLLGPKEEADFLVFVNKIWRNITSERERRKLTASMVWQVPMPGIVLYSCPTQAAVNVHDARALITGPLSVQDTAEPLPAHFLQPDIMSCLIMQQLHCLLRWHVTLH